MAKRKRNFVIVFPNIYAIMFGVDTVYKVRATSEEEAQGIAQSELDRAIDARTIGTATILGGQ